jgi:hypothetical protein
MEDQTKPKKTAPDPKAAAAPSVQPTPAPRPAPLPEPNTFSLDDSAFEGAVGNDKTAHYRPTTAHLSSSWVRGPGAVTLLVEAGHDLNHVSALRGAPVSQVEFVRVLALPAVKSLLIWPTTEEDLNKIPVTWRNGQAHFNASAVLIRAKIPVESGRKKRFEVHVLKDSKVGPALAIDMRYSLDLRIMKSAGSDKETRSGSPADDSADDE